MQAFMPVAYIFPANDVPRAAGMIQVLFICQKKI